MTIGVNRQVGRNSQGYRDALYNRIRYVRIVREFTVNCRPWLLWSPFSLTETTHSPPALETSSMLVLICLCEIQAAGTKEQLCNCALFSFERQERHRAAPGSPVGGGAWSSFAGGPSNSVKIGLQRIRPNLVAL